MLELKKVSKSYGQGDLTSQILNDISLTVAEGDFVSIMGASGSGKSTLINILGLLDADFQGDYLLDGRNINELDDDQRAIYRNRDIGFVFQDFHLIEEYTVEENILLPFLYSKSEPDKQLIGNLVESLGLKNKLTEYPNYLSGGQKQRVALIRALAHVPKFLIADEPTGSLDEKNRDEILQILKSLNASGTTIVVVTHDEFVASCSKKQYQMKNGALLLRGGESNVF